MAMATRMPKLPLLSRRKMLRTERNKFDVSIRQTMREAALIQVVAATELLLNLALA